MSELFLPAAAGTETLLAEEVTRLLGRPAEAGAGGVFVTGAEPEAMRVNLHSRLAQRVLWWVADAPYRDEHDLYDWARSLPWEHWITPEQTLRVDTHAHRSPLHSVNFATLRIKDAVCDRLRDLTGTRPSVDTRHPDLSLVLYAGPERATLYVDTSGEALFKRGWRDARGGSVDVKGEAPLKETLAAAMLAAAGWQGRAEDGPLLDPCCGAGTIAIEAAQMACNLAPGLTRRFAFETLKPFATPAWRAAWGQMQQQARAAVCAPRVAVHAGDISFRLTDFAERNAERAGVAHAIQFKTADVLQRPPPAAAGTIVMNPPYGERIEAKGSLGAARGQRAEGGFQRDGEFRAGAEPHAARPAVREGREAFGDDTTAAAFHAALAAHWKRHYAGWTAWVLSPDAKLPSQMRLKESRRVPLWNGPIECRLFRFDLVAGSARKAPSAGEGQTAEPAPAPAMASRSAPPGAGG